ncbi:MAG TPA: efflux RND transporter periplasmic adaptor subunit [Bryobacteraceae bacterium]|nr:efflux RND transporter periplasmic adaptor subunit [Bryobacteraceae bacterium]
MNMCKQLLLPSLAALLLTACSRTTQSESQMTSFTAGETKGDTANLFTLPADQIAHLQIAPAVRGSLPRTLRFTGSVAYNALATTPVFSAAGGPVREILVLPGDMVRAGQPLLTINSPDYSQARSAYLKSKDAFALADKNYKRAQDLFEHKAIAERDVQQAESDRSQAQADVESTTDVLRALGVADPEATVKAFATLLVPLLAPVKGEIVERLVGPGQLLQAGMTQCFTISDTGTVWVLVNVYQSDLGSVHIGDSADITTDAYPEVFRGRISYIAPAVDPTTRTLQERIVTENPAHKLKKDMYVTATVRAGAIGNAILVPDAAVLHDSENQPFLYLQTGATQFARRLVTLGDSSGGRTQITSGLKEGEPVVGDGSLFLQFQNSMQH